MDDEHKAAWLLTSFCGLSAWTVSSAFSRSMIAIGLRGPITLLTELVLFFGTFLMLMIVVGRRTR